MFKKTKEISTFNKEVEKKTITKGQLETYFFPKERVSIKATSQEEAIKILKTKNI